MDKTQLKVTHVCSSSPYGGIQRLVESLASEQIRQGKNSLICLCDTWRRDFRVNEDYLLKKLESHGIPYKKIDPLSPKSFKEIYNLVSQSDLLHLHSPPSWFLIIASAFKCQPWITHIHRYPERSKALKTWFIESLLGKLSDAFIAVSNSVAAAVRNSMPSTRKKVFTVYNGIDTKEAIHCDFKKNSLSQNDWNGPLIGMASRLAFNKGLDIFLTAADVIKKKLPTANYILAGEGPEKGALEEIIESKKLKENVCLCGFVEDIYHFWGKVDFCLFTSRQEPFGLRILEAQLCGAIVVGFLNGSGSDEVIINHETGVLVPWGDYEALANTLISLWQNRRKRLYMKKRAIETLRNEFSIEVMTETIDYIYNIYLN